MTTQQTMAFVGQIEDAADLLRYANFVTNIEMTVPTMTVGEADEIRATYLPRMEVLKEALSYPGNARVLEFYKKILKDLPKAKVRQSKPKKKV